MNSRIPLLPKQTDKVPFSFPALTQVIFGYSSSLERAGVRVERCFGLFPLMSYLHQFVEAKMRMAFMVGTTMPTLDVCLMSQHDLVSPLIVLTRKNHQREPRSLRSHQAVSFVAKFVCCWKETSRLDEETFVHSMSFKHRSGLVRVAVLDEEQWVEVWKDDLE